MPINNNPTNEFQSNKESSSSLKISTADETNNISDTSTDLKNTKDILEKSIKDSENLNRLIEISDARNNVLTDITTGATLEDICKKIFDYILYLTDSTLCFVGYIDNDSNTSEPILKLPTLSEVFKNGLCSVKENTNKLPYYKQENIIAKSLKEQKTIIWDVEKDGELKSSPEGHVNMTKVLLVPAICDKETLGIITIANPRSGEFSESNIEIIKVFAKHLANAVNKKNTINELNKKKIAAEQANKIKTEFIASVNHELRTPINAIIHLGNFTKKRLENILRYIKNIDDNFENIEDIIKELNDSIKDINDQQESSKDLLNIINNVLDLSKIESGQFNLEIKEVNIESILKNCLNKFSSLCNKDHLYLKLDYNDDIKNVLIDSDEVRIIQIINNFLSNAIKFTSEGGITIKAEVNDSSQQIHKLGHIFKLTQCNQILTLSVIDTGIGIKQKDLEKIFQSFVQIDRGYSKKYQGTGIGLTISKKLASLLTGDITVESDYGNGSTFSLHIPIKEKLNYESKSNKTPITKEKEIKLDEVIKDKRILLAEDNKINQSIALEILKNAKEIVVVENGEEVIKIMESNKSFDFILMDIQMPEMDGFEATKEIRKKGYNIPIIGLTAHSLEDIKSQCLDSNIGMNGFATKPININELAITINDSINLPKIKDIKIDKFEVLNSNNLNQDVNKFLEKYNLNKYPLKSIIIEYIFKQNENNFGNRALYMIINVFFKENILENFKNNFDIIINFYNKLNSCTNYSDDEIKKLKTAAHSIKGSICSYGAIKLAKFSLEIESKLDKTDKSIIKSFEEEAIKFINDFKIMSYIISKIKESEKENPKKDLLEQILKDLEKIKKSEVS